ncbi:MAG TPA: electron transfer flavoprotein subunit beta/FixA family protein [Anaerolineaceae bacterium]|nr:electron transfer flavoprotein subunit beta/FixA family protein [Anaerolineaceae bacterium]HPN51882.1 electron transfer flavoprotein subunit beta/FixA family protein [Anaerolineaceae bacterium]
MHIIVPIKQVPETSNVKMDPETGTMIRTGVEAIINPLDLYAIEAALRLREALKAKVTTITMGPPKAEKALREAMAMGCDAGILISHKAFGGSDTWATAYTLAQAVRHMDEGGLILCGERATDGDTGQVGPELAAALDLPVATYVRRILSASPEGLRVERLVEGGVETLWVPLPAVLTVVKDVASPRLPTLRGLQRARQSVIPTWGPDEIETRADWIGLQGSPTRVVKIERPQVSRKAELRRIKDAADVDRAASDLVEFLRQRSLVD